MMLVWVGLAGSAGACARFLISEAIAAWRATGFPWGTLIVNITGSALLGAVAGLVIFGDASGSLLSVAGAGFCGGYTTFSTASVDTWRLLGAGRYWSALGNAAGTLALTVLAGGAGIAAGSMW